jgi:hypothetical protein
VVEDGREKYKPQKAADLWRIGFFALSDRYLEKCDLEISEDEDGGEEEDEDDDGGVESNERGDREDTSTTILFESEQIHRIEPQPAEAPSAKRAKITDTEGNPHNASAVALVRSAATAQNPLEIPSTPPKPPNIDPFQPTAPDLTFTPTADWISERTGRIERNITNATLAYLTHHAIPASSAATCITDDPPPALADLYSRVLGPHPSWRLALLSLLNTSPPTPTPLRQAHLLTALLGAAITTHVLDAPPPSDLAGAARAALGPAGMRYLRDAVGDLGHGDTAEEVLELVASKQSLDPAWWGGDDVAARARETVGRIALVLVPHLQRGEGEVLMRMRMGMGSLPRTQPQQQRQSGELEWIEWLERAVRAAMELRQATSVVPGSYVFEWPGAGTVVVREMHQTLGKVGEGARILHPVLPAVVRIKEDRRRCFAKAMVIPME